MINEEKNMIKTIQLAVNGTLMRGLKLNANLIQVGAKFIREDKTDAHYRLWSINDDHPGMIRVDEGGNTVDLEIWEVPAEGVASVLLNEPAGLAIGKVRLQDNSYVLGVIAEPWLTEGQKEITHLGGWRRYTAQITK